MHSLGSFHAAIGETKIRVEPRHIMHRRRHARNMPIPQLAACRPAKSLLYYADYDHARTRTSLVSIQPPVAAAVHRVHGRPVFDRCSHGLERFGGHRSRWRCGRNSRKDVVGPYTRGRAREHVCGRGHRRLCSRLEHCLQDTHALGTVLGAYCGGETRSDCRLAGRRGLGRLYGTISLGAIAEAIADTRAATPLPASNFILITNSAWRYSRPAVLTSKAVATFNRPCGRSWRPASVAVRDVPFATQFVNCKGWHEAWTLPAVPAE